MTSSQSKNSKAILLGAYDRFNYGDLLFPLVVRNEFGKHSPETDTLVHALVSSDLSRYGALKTQSIKALYQPRKLTPGDTVIFAGGGTIGSDWNNMLANLLGRKGNAALYYLQKLLGNKAVNVLSRHYFGAVSPFPWVAEPNDFPVSVRVAYNAVGGSEFSRLTPKAQKQTLERLGKASYLSVRDAESQRLLSPIEHRLPVELAPDSAILMSEQFPVPWLESQASTELLNELNSGPYVCFQSNLNYAKKNTDRIVRVLESIYNERGLRALLLPIGRYVGLDDQIALHNIKVKLTSPAKIISDDASIFEIMLTISRAKLFLGTSLHGNISSQSFAVPHIGLSDSPCKVDFYLETWDLPEQSRCLALQDVPEHVSKVMAIPETTRQAKRQELIALSHGNFARMATACGINWQS